MSNVQFSNFAATTLASGINASVTSLTVATGTGALFPTLAGAQYFYAVIADAATGTTREVIKVTARSTDSFTITRGQDGTTGATFIAGDKVELRLTAAGIATFATTETAQTFAGVQTFSSAPVLSVPLAATGGGTGFASYTLGDIIYASSTTAFSKLSASTSGLVLKTNGAGTAPTWGSVGGTPPTMQVFTSGTGTYTRPSGCTVVEIYIKAGGGGGGTGNGAASANWGGGGGEGQEGWLLATAATIGATISYAVGAGGAGSTTSSGASGSTGGTTSISTIFTAIGGDGGMRGNFGGQGGNGGNGGTGGNYYMAGDPGAAGSDPQTGTSRFTPTGGGKGGGNLSNGDANSGGGGGGSSGAGSGGNGGSGVIVFREYY
jgi:hypothetical protein